MLKKDKYIQINQTLNTINRAVAYIPNLAVKTYVPTVKALLADLSEAVREINLELLDSPIVSFCDMEYLQGNVTDYAHKKELVKQYKVWHRMMLEVLERQHAAENIWDEKFVRLMDYVRFVDFDMIVENAKASLRKQDDVMQKRLCAYYQRFEEMWGTLDIDNNRYDVITNRITELKEHQEDFMWLTVGWATGDPDRF